MLCSPLQITLSSPAATCRFAAQLAARLNAGDTLLLRGDIGAGKTHFARCFILSLLAQPEDVPSPTYTLVQTYQANGFEIWHADLYRLSHPDEAVELGLDDAFDQALCLVEWPDRLGDLAPAHALTLLFEPGTRHDTRLLTLTWTNPRWADCLKGLTDD